MKNSDDLRFLASFHRKNSRILYKRIQFTMKLIKGLPALFLLLLMSSVNAATWTGISSDVPAVANCRVISQQGNETVLFIRVEGFHQQAVNTATGAAIVITTPGGKKSLEAGAPDLPRIIAPLVVPKGATMEAEVIGSSFRDFPGLTIAPSKGNLYRDQDPAAVPYTYGKSYGRDTYYPGVTTQLETPYMLRDFAGQTLVVQPFQYNPVTKNLRVYFSMTIRVKPVSADRTLRVAPPSVMDVTYAPIYASHFVNYNSFNYTPLYDAGRMLVIADSALLPLMHPFVVHKNKMGQRTEIVAVNTIGNTPSQIKSYIELEYFTGGLTFVLLVGDGSQVVTNPTSSGDSDPSYGYILGNDSYAEVIVGRFSANDSTELVTQVRRSIDYELSPVAGATWYKRAICVASDEGPGDDNEMDFEHARLMRQDLMNYTYDLVDELYDGSQGLADSAGNPTAADMVAALNEGRGLITYTGHGSTSGCSTTGFNLNNLQQLVNFDQLPFFWSVACVNGNFTNATCLAEGLLRSTDSTGRARGAIATLMSTINQSWDPPMDGQDEMVDLLVETYPSNIKRTFGGLSVNGCMHMNDVYGAAGAEMTDTWTCFGDPSLNIRTAEPQPLVVTHPSSVEETSLAMQIGVSVDSALCCLSLRDSIVSTSWSLLGAAFFSYSGLAVGDTLDLTVTGYNCIPYTARIPVVAAMNTGIGTTTIIDPLRIFPNPVRDQLTLATTTFSKGDLQVVLINSLGQTVKTLTNVKDAPAGDYSFTYDVSTLSRGIYQLRVISGTEDMIRRIVIY